MELEEISGREPGRSKEGRRSVLIVDDEREIVSVLSELLRKEGYCALSAHDGERALELYRSERPRIVVADIKMPGMNGLELLKRVKGQDGERVEVIMMSGYMDAEYAIESLRHGASRYLRKPVAAQELFATLRESEDKLRLIDERNELLETLEDKVLARTREMEAGRAFLQSVIDGLEEPIMVIDGDHQVRLLNRAARQEAGTAPSSGPMLCHKTIHNRDTPCEGAQAPCPFKEVVESGLPRTVVHERKSAKGRTRFIEILASPLFAKDGSVEAVIESLRDITDRRLAVDTLRAKERHIKRVTRFDVLTGLPNRASFNDRLGLALGSARQNSRLMAVLFIDLDRFKIINETMGRAVGDLLLRETAMRLKGCLRQSDALACFSGAEFVILLPDIHHARDLSNVARKILEALSRVFVQEGREFFTTASIGMSIWPDDGEDAHTLLKNATAALNLARAQGGNTYAFYVASMNASAFQHLELETSMHNALKRKEFRVLYQPLIDLRSGRICGMEALMRWQHPDLGLLMPEQFIPVAEETGMIVHAGEWALREACGQSKAWQDAGGPSLIMSVNISARQFLMQDLVDMVGRALADTGAAPEALELELTESVIMQNMEDTVNKLRKLSDMGVRISVDDFGTGYSSLSYLKKFPLHTLKIDKSFINDITTSRDDAAIAAAIIAMAHSLKLKVVAEGVETIDQLEQLRAMQCDIAQGYLFSRPTTASDLHAMAREEKAPLLPSGPAPVVPKDSGDRSVA